MAVAKTFSGARAKISVDGVLVGMFDSVSYGSNVGAEPIHTLGKFGPQEIVPTSYEAVQVQCSGFRIIGQGANVLPKMPKLNDLLNLNTVTISITDRQTGQTIMTVIGCVPTSYSTGHNAKAISKLNITYMGTKLEEESGAQSEDGTGAAKSTSLP